MRPAYFGDKSHPRQRPNYATLSAKHLEPAPFGEISLDKLKASDMEALILALRAKTKPAKTEGAEPERALSDSTIRSIYIVLRVALDGAVRDNVLARNPATVIESPGVERREAKYLPAEVVKAVLKAAEGSRYHPALVLIATTGLRKGECLALKWSEVDLEAGEIRVRGTLGRVNKQLRIKAKVKTDSSRREIPLHHAVVTMLRKHRVAQMEERLAAANIWKNEDLVFPNETGGKVDPRNFLRVIEKAATKAEIEGVGVHILRHSAATAWLDSGYHIREVADLLGHSSISITGDIYTHGSSAGARRAVGTLGDQLGLGQ